MFTEKDYVCVCHGCGAFHIVRSAFMSSAMSVGFKSTTTEGRSWSVPAHACPTCHAIKTATREEHPIARAFDHGMTPESKARSQREFETEWETKLEARREEAM